MATRPHSRIDQLLLPFAEKEYIDVRRAAAILGLSTRAIFLLREARLIEMIDYAKRKRKRVRYQSIVDLCDELRQRYAIRDRRPPTAPMLRHRDADLLPFPIEDTIEVERVMSILGYSSATPVLRLIEEGRFEAYHFLPNSPWRISRTSLADYLYGVHQRAKGSPLNLHP